MVYLGEGRSGRATTVDKRDTDVGRSSKSRMMYTNVDGLLSSVMEVKDYLKDSKPNVLCIAEMKLKEIHKFSRRGM